MPALEITEFTDPGCSEQHHMPIDTRERPRMAATLPACRSVVAARLNAPERERAMLRAMRVQQFSAHLLDEPQTIADAARAAGLDPDDVDRWLTEPATEEALREDLRLAREPSASALALSHKLAAELERRPAPTT